MKLAAVIFGLLISVPTLAQVKDMGSAFEAGKQFANTGKTSAGSMVNSSTGSSQLPHYNNNAPESSSFGGGRNLITGIGNSKITNCRGYKADNEFNQQECDAVNFLAKNTNERPKFDLGKDDPLINGSGNIIKNPGAGTGTNTQQCRIEMEKIPAKFTEETCTETNYIENTSCRKRLIVQCSAPADNCASGGITPNSATVSNGSYEFQFDGSTMNLVNNITAVNNTTQAVYTFDIKNVGLITVFNIFQIVSDNWVGLEINGTYIGTHSRRFLGFNTNSDRLTVAWENWCRPNDDGNSTVCSDDLRVRYGPGENDFFYPETGGAYVSSVAFDLKPYLREGSNTIIMRVVNGGGPGNGTVSISARQQCPIVCWDNWDTSACGPLESRS